MFRQKKFYFIFACFTISDLLLIIFPNQNLHRTHENSSSKHMNKSHQQSPTNSGGVDSSQSFAQSPSDTRTEKTEMTVVESESRSYDPYLIAYHEETNSFTYNDPWIQVDLTNGSCCDENEIVCDVSESDSYEPPQPDMETESAEYCAVPMLEVTTAHEHEPEVSFHDNNNAASDSATDLDSYQTKNHF